MVPSLLALVIMVAWVIPTAICVPLSLLPSRKATGLDLPRHRARIRTWDRSFSTLLVLQIITILSPLLVSEEVLNDIVGPAEAVIVLSFGVLVSVASFRAARALGRQPWAWAVCALIASFPGPATFAFGISGAIAMRRASRETAR